MCLLEDGQVPEALVGHGEGAHQVLPQLEHEDAHEERLRLAGADTAQIDDNPALEELCVVKSDAGKDHAVNPVGQGSQAREQGSLVGTLVLGIILARVEDLPHVARDVRKRGVESLPVIIGGLGQVPPAILVGVLDGLLEHRGHRGVHRPADVEDLHEPVQVLKDMDARGEGKRIEPQQRCDQGVGPKDPDVTPRTKGVLVLALRRFDHKEACAHPVCLREELTDRVGLARSRAARHEHVGGKRVREEPHGRSLLMQHVKHPAERELVRSVRADGRVGRDAPAKLRTLYHRKPRQGLPREVEGQRQLLAAQRRHRAHEGRIDAEVIVS